MVAAVLALFVPALSASGPGPSCIPLRGTARAELPYEAGERMSFVVHYKWGIIDADVASASFSLDDAWLNGRPAFTARVYGQNARAFDPFFKVREDFRAWFSADGLDPLRFTRDTNDDNRLLVWVDTPIKIGRVYARITDWSGLKHPFDALVEPAKRK